MGGYECIPEEEEKRSGCDVSVCLCSVFQRRILLVLRTTLSCSGSVSIPFSVLGGGSSGGGERVERASPGWSRLREDGGETEAEAK